MKRILGIIMLTMILLPPILLFNFQANASVTYGSTESNSGISISGSYLTKEIRRNIKTITINQTNINITAGTALAPHLYDWYFNGKNSYMVLDYGDVVWSTTSVSAGAYAKLEQLGFLFSWSNTWATHRGFQLKTGYNLASWVVIGNGTVMENYYISASDILGQWHLYAFRFYNGVLRIFYDDQNQTYTLSFTSYQPTSTDTMYVGALDPYNYHIKGKVAYLFVSSSAWIGINNLATGNTVIDNVPHFFDPTWFNGTHYMDSKGQFYLIPHNVVRILAEHPFLWVVNGLYSDGYVHLRYFPTGSSVMFYNATNHVLVKKVVVTSDDVKVALPSGKYDVVVHTFINKISIHIIGSLIDCAEIEVINGGSALTNYPLKIELNASNFDYWSQLSTQNIYLTDANGKPLQYWIEKLDVVNKEAVIWVKANLTTGVNILYLHYGSSNPYSSYNSPNGMFFIFENWSESVNISSTGPANNLLVGNWNNTISDNSADALWVTTINTTSLYMYVKDTSLGDNADLNTVWYTQKIPDLPVTVYITIDPPSFIASSSISIGFTNETPLTQSGWASVDYVKVSFASWIPGTRIVTNNGTTNVYNQYSFLPPTNAYTKLMLKLDKTNLYLWYYNTTLSRWVYVGNVTLNFDPTAVPLYFFITVSAWSGGSQSLYVKPYTIVYYDPATSLSESVARSGSSTVVLYPNIYDVSYVKISAIDGIQYIDIAPTSYNVTYNELNVSGLGKRVDIDVLLTSDFNPILYLNSYNNYTYFPYGYNVSLTSAMLNKTLSPVAGYPINYTIAETDPHRIIEQKISIGKVITVEANIIVGTTLAPHLYDWFLDGTGYISLGNVWNPSSFFALRAMVKLLDTSTLGQRIIVKDNGAVGWALSWNDAGTDKFRFFIRGTTSVVLDSNTIGELGKTYILNAFVNGSGRYIFINGTYNAGVADNQIPVSNTNPLCVGGSPSSGNSFHGYIYYAMIYNAPIVETNNIVNGTVLALFLDPTFFNGSDYFDLVNSSVVGVPYGGVYRVPANKTWVWVVNGLYNDGYVHLRYFPNGTIIKVYTTSGELVREFTITGTPNKAGLIDDFKIILPSGTYKIIAEIPSGNILAPHLYDWYFNGTGHIKLPLLNLFFSPKATIETYIKPNGKTGYIEDVFRAQTMWVNGWTNGYLYPSFRVYLYFNASWHYINIGNIVGWSSIGLGYINGSNGLFVGYVNGTEIGSITGNLIITPSRVYVDIGSENGIYYYKGWIAYIKYYTNFDPSIFQSTILSVNRSKLVLFDPTFFNGSVYFDLVNSSVVGVPYGGVYRVPTNKTWIWNVITYNYGQPVDLKWFPVGSVLQFIDPTTGDVVKEVVVTSINDSVDIPAGTYILRVYVGIKDYRGQLVTDSSGQIHIYLVTPSNDSLIFIQVHSSGYYMGLQTLRIVSTNVSYTVDVPDMVKKNVPFNYTVKALLSATGLPVVKITVNGTLFDTYIKTLSFKYNESGHHNFTLLLTGSRDAVNVSYVFRKTLFVGGHVNWIVTLSPNYIPYPLNYSFRAYLDVKYDNGERVTVPVSVNVTRLDTMKLVYTNTSKPVINMSLVAVWDLRLTAKMTDLDGESYTFSYTIWTAIPHQSFSIVVKDRGYVFLLNTTIKHVFLEHEPDKYNQTIIFLDFFNFSIDVYRDYVLVLSQNATNPMYFNVPQGYEADVYFDMIGKKIVMYVYLPGAVRPGTMTVINVNPLVATTPNIALPVPSNNMFSSYGLIGSILSTAMILGVGIGFARAERDPVTGVAIASAIMVPVSLLIGNQTAYYISLAILVISLGYKIMRWLTS